MAMTDARPTLHGRPLSGPPLWYGPEMARRTDWLRPLTSAEIEALGTAAARLDASGIDVAAIVKLAKDVNLVPTN